MDIFYLKKLSPTRHQKHCFREIFSRTISACRPDYFYSHPAYAKLIFYGSSLAHYYGLLGLEDLDLYK